MWIGPPTPLNRSVLSIDTTTTWRPKAPTSLLLLCFTPQIIDALRRLFPAWCSLLGYRRDAWPISSRIAFLLLLPIVSNSGAGTLPAPSGKFTFEGNPYIGTASLTNTAVTNNSLHLNGVYFMQFGKPSGAEFRPRVFDYRRFTVVVKLQPEDSREKTLFAGGTASRWFVIRTDKQSRVELSFNNFEFRHPIGSLAVTNGQWITLALVFDLQARRALVYADGRRADEVVLPKDFDFYVIKDATWREPDKVLTFTDYSNGNTFKGLVSGVLIFDTILSADQVRRLFPKH
jgi:hypothetical protein